MNLKSINRRAISFKVAILAIVVAFATFVGLGVCSTHQAKAENADSASNASLIVTHELDEYSPTLELQYTENWYPPTSHPGYKTVTWTNGMDLLATYDAEGKTTEVHYRCGFSYTSSLYITLYDSVNNSYKDFIIHLSDSNAFSWSINGQEVNITEKSITNLTTPINFDCDVVPDFEVWGTVYEIDGETPIEGATVEFYTMDGKPVEGATDTTDEDGEYDIESIETLNLPGYLLVTCPNYEKEKTKIEFTPDFEREQEIDFSLLPEGSESEVYIEGAEHHLYFEITMTEYVAGEAYVETEIMDVIKDINIKTGVNYVINEDGSMKLTQFSNDEESNVVIKPVCDEGYVVDKWNINGSDLEVGKTYEVEEDDIVGLVTYKIPEITETEVNANSQTGDAMPLAAVALSVIALIAGAVLLRKSYK